MDLAPARVAALWVSYIEHEAQGLDNQRVIVDQQELRLGGRVRIGAPSGVVCHHTPQSL